MITENVTLGFALVLLAGVFQGSFMVPMKFTRTWKWENAWLIFASFAYLILPWLIAFITVPRLMTVLQHVQGGTVLQTLLFGLGWGLGALMFGLGVDYLGLALGFAIILGLTSAIGTLVPLLVLSPETLTESGGLWLLVGTAIVILGIAVCSWAGSQKERSLAGGGRSVTGNEPRSYALGLLFCILSGVLSPFGNLGFAFGSDITETALRFGTPEGYAANPLWAIIAMPLFLCNAGFAVYLLSKNNSFARYSSSPRIYLLFGVAMGALWYAGMSVYGAGANMLGPIGASIGWAVLMSSMVIIANVWGMVTGEWKGVGGRPRLVMFSGVLLLVVAIFVIGLSRS